MNRYTFCAGLLLISLSGCGRIIESSQARLEFQQPLDVTGIRLAVIETRNGSVDVLKAAADVTPEVSGSKYVRGATQAEADQRLEQIRIVVEREAQRPEVLRIVADFNGLTSGSPGANFRVILPPDIELGMVTSNAAITAAHRNGRIKAQTSNGSITVEAIQAAVELQTSNARITVSNVTGNVDATSSNGAIQLNQVGSDRVNAVTSNASITAVEPRGAVTLVSSNGPVNLTAAAPFAQVSVHTSNASANVKLPANLKGSVRLNTSNAGVHTNLKSAQVTDTNTGRSSFAATLNGGGTTAVNVETSNGSIHFDLIVPASPRTAEKPESP